MTDQLNEADMQIMGSAECSAIWGSEYRADVHICITSENNDKGSCNVSQTLTCALLNKQDMF